MSRNSSEHISGNDEEGKGTIDSNSSKDNEDLVPTTASELLSAPDDDNIAVAYDGSTKKERSTTSSSSSSPLSLFDGKDDRLNLNLDGALYRILEYLTPSDFYTLGALTGSRFWKRFFFENPRSEYLFAPPGNPKRTKGRHHLKNLYFFRQSLGGILKLNDAKKGQKRNRKGSQQQQKYSLHEKQQQQPLNRVGVFSPQEENSILSNDQNGYFGLSFFRPGVLAVWGDYSGMFLTSHVDRLFSVWKQLAESSHEEVRMCSGGTTAECKTSTADDEKEKATTTDASPDPFVPSDTNQTKGDEGCGYLFADSYQVVAVLFGCKPYVFLGFASGTIHSIDSRPIYKDPPPSSPSKDPTTTESGKIVEYPHVSECSYHRQKGEISSLASVEDRHLVSGSVRPNAKTSEILIHWNALKDGNLQRISRIKIDVETFQGGVPMEGSPDDIPDVSPLAMASCVSPMANVSSILQRCGPVLSIGAKGQNLVHLGLWKKTENNNDSENNNAFDGIDFGTDSDPDKPPPLFKPLEICHCSRISTVYRIYRMRRRSERRSHHFVYLKYFRKTNLIVGTSKGDLLRLDMKPENSFNMTQPRVLYNCCRGGMVETVELVGNKNPIMITGGGYDGRIQFWDWDTFHSLGSLRIHPGQQALVAEAALASTSRSVGRTTTAMPIAHHRYSPVVSTFFCHERSSLVSFCRDGHLHEWMVEVEAKKHKQQTTMMLVTTNTANNDKSSNRNNNNKKDTKAAKRIGGGIDKDESQNRCILRRTRRRSVPSP